MISIRRRVLPALAAAAMVLTVPVASVAMADSASAAVTAPATSHPHSSVKARKVTSNPDTPVNAVSTPKPRRSVSVPGSTSTGGGNAVTSRPTRRAVTTPIGTGAITVSGVSRTSPVANRAVPETHKVRISSSTYSVAGTRYAYHPASTYQGRPLPRRGTHDYWVLLNDPFYGPNYVNPFSPWYVYYHTYHTYPLAGYTLVNGYFQPVSSGLGGLAIVGIIVGLIVAAFVIWFIIAVARQMKTNRRARESEVPVGGGWRE